MFAIKIETSQDSAGNPRRGWLVYERPGVCVAFIQEGHTGERPLRQAFPAFGPHNASGVPGSAVVTCVLEVTRAEWRRTVQVQRERDRERKDNA